MLLIIYGTLLPGKGVPLNKKGPLARAFPFGMRIEN